MCSLPLPSVETYLDASPTSSNSSRLAERCLEHRLHSRETQRRDHPPVARPETTLYSPRHSALWRTEKQVVALHDECLRKYRTSVIWRYWSADFLPLWALVDGRVFCIRSGLSPDRPPLYRRRIVPRTQEASPTGPMCDLLWSDPEGIEDWSASRIGAGYVLASDVVCPSSTASTTTMSPALSARVIHGGIPVTL